MRLNATLQRFKGLGGEQGEEDYKPQNALVFYLKNMLPSFFLNLLLQLVSAQVYSAIDDALMTP